MGYIPFIQRCCQADLIPVPGCISDDLMKGDADSKDLGNQSWLQEKNIVTTLYVDCIILNLYFLTCNCLQKTVLNKVYDFVYLKWLLSISEGKF